MTQAPGAEPTKPAASPFAALASIDPAAGASSSAAAAAAAPPSNEVSAPVASTPDATRAVSSLTGASSATVVELPNDFVCSISTEIFEDPVVAADGHTYEVRLLITVRVQGCKAHVVCKASKAFGRGT